MTSALILARISGSVTGWPSGPRYRNPRPQRLRAIPAVVRSLRLSLFVTDVVTRQGYPAGRASSTPSLTGGTWVAVPPCA
jgi:hypothetical protein